MFTTAAPTAGALLRSNINCCTTAPKNHDQPRPHVYYGAMCVCMYLCRKFCAHGPMLGREEHPSPPQRQHQVGPTTTHHGAWLASPWPQQTSQRVYHTHMPTRSRCTYPTNNTTPWREVEGCEAPSTNSGSAPACLHACLARLLRPDSAPIHIFTTCHQRQGVPGFTRKMPKGETRHLSCCFMHSCCIAAPSTSG